MIEADIEAAIEAKQQHSTYRVIEDCPVAQCLRRYYPGRRIRVTPYTANIGQELYYIRGITRAFIIAYDKENTVSPIKFRLHIV